jgi:hypothetical protein
MKKKHEVEIYGFTRTFTSRHGPQMFIFIIIVVAVAAGIGVNKLPIGLSGPDVTTAIIAVGAVILGYQQWNAARNEVSLDKFYERLEVTNQRLDEWDAARSLAGPWPRARSAQSRSEIEFYHCAMYTYRELDNLEYAIAKYKLGFMSSEHALRSLRTFKARCISSPEFRELALECVGTNWGYDPVTIKVVKKVCSEFDAPQT